MPPEYRSGAPSSCAASSSSSTPVSASLHVCTHAQACRHRHADTGTQAQARRHAQACTHALAHALAHARRRSNRRAGGRAGDGEAMRQEHTCAGPGARCTASDQMPMPRCAHMPQGHGAAPLHPCTLAGRAHAAQAHQTRPEMPACGGRARESMMGRMGIRLTVPHSPPYTSTRSGAQMEMLHSAPYTASAGRRGRHAGQPPYCSTVLLGRERMSECARVCVFGGGGGGLCVRNVTRCHSIQLGLDTSKLRCALSLCLTGAVAPSVVGKGFYAILAMRTIHSVHAPQAGHTRHKQAT